MIHRAICWQCMTEPIGVIGNRLIKYLIQPNATMGYGIINRLKIGLTTCFLIFKPLKKNIKKPPH